MAEYIIYSNKYSLQERTTKSGERLWDLYFRIEKDGKTRQKKISGSKTKTEAKSRYNQFVSEHCEFRHERPKKEGKPETKTIEEIYCDWCKVMDANNASATLYDRKNIYKNYILPKFGRTKADEITPQDINAWLYELSMLKKPNGELYSWNYRDKIRESFQSLYSWYTVLVKISNPFREVIKTPGKKKKVTAIDFWEREEFEQFITAVDEPMYKTFFSLVFFTGQREGEVMALTPDDISLDRQTIRFEKSITYKTNDGSLYKIVPTKSGKEREIPVCAPAIEALKNYEWQYPFIFGKERPLATTTIARKFDKYIALSGVRRIRFHDLRHSFVTMLFHNGVNPTVIADLTGDTLEQITRTYAHMYISDRNAAVASIT